MNIVARRRIAATVVAASSGAVAVFLIAPSADAVGASGSQPVSAAASASPSPSGTTGTFTGFTRLAGTDRYGTAARIATRSFPSGAAQVIIANGESDNPKTSANENHFPDALAGAYLAGSKSAPTLLTTRDALPKATTDALSSLKTTTVTILGGTSAVSSAVENQLKQSYTVTRIAGATRYDTAKAVAEQPGASYVGSDPNGKLTAVVASGQNFPDALVAGPLGYKSKFPILLTTTSTLSSQTRQALTDLKIKNVLIPGGTAVVSSNVESQIQAMGITTQRFAGASRMETATKVATYEVTKLAYSTAHINLANGANFPDALAGGPHGGTDGAAILLTSSPDVLGSATESYLSSQSGKLQDGHIFGGTAAVTQSAQDQASKDANGGTAPGPSATPTPSASPSPSCTPSLLTSCPSPSASATPSGSGSPSASASTGPSGSPSPTCTPGLLSSCPTPSASASSSTSASPSASASASASASPTASASATSSPSSSGTPSPSPTCLLLPPFC